VRVAHPRTGLVLARGGGVLAALERPFSFGLGGPLASGRAWWSWVALGDFVRAIRVALRDERIRGPFNLVAPAPVRQGEFARALGRGSPPSRDRAGAGVRAPGASRSRDGRRHAAREPARAARGALGAGFQFEEPALEPCLLRLYARTPAAR
jgi:nucleoside-diphosphate-sugar epimerase